MNIESLIVTQCGLRDLSQVASMVYFVKHGGIYNKEAISKFTRPGKSAELIQITEFEDGSFYIQDGHHRIMSIYLAGNRDFLYPEEYEIQLWRYEHYREIRWDMKWVTPYDPISQVRVLDYKNFKNEVFSRYVVSESEAVSFINNNTDMYCMSRGDRTNIEALATSMFQV